MMSVIILIIISKCLIVNSISWIFNFINYVNPFFISLLDYILNNKNRFFNIYFIFILYLLFLYYISLYIYVSMLYCLILLIYFELTKFFETLLKVIIYIVLIIFLSNISLFYYINIIFFLKFFVFWLKNDHNLYYSWMNYINEIITKNYSIKMMEYINITLNKLNYNDYNFNNYFKIKLNDFFVSLTYYLFFLLIIFIYIKYIFHIFFLIEEICIIIHDYFNSFITFFSSTKIIYSLKIKKIILFLSIEIIVLLVIFYYII